MTIERENEGASVASSGARAVRIPILLSHRQPLVTLAHADVGGPARRLREVVSSISQLSWRPPPLPNDPAFGSSFVLVAAGSSAAGMSICISSIVVYPARASHAARAYVYVEERRGGAWLPSKARPFLLVQCPRLPADTWFVEVPPPCAQIRPTARSRFAPPSRRPLR